MSLIHELIPKVMKDIGAVSKDRRNEQQKYAFRGIEDLLYAAQPAMVEHGIFCAPKILKRDVYRFEKTNDQGRVTTWNHVAIEVEYTFFASDGSSVPVVAPGEGLDNSDKATNKAMSAAMKYALIQLFCVPTKDVEDADRTSPEAGMAYREKDNGPSRPKESITFVKPELPKAAPTISADPYISEEEAKDLYIYARTFLDKSLHSKCRGWVHDWCKAKGLVDVKGDGTLLKVQRVYVDSNGKEVSGIERTKKALEELMKDRNVQAFDNAKEA